MKPYALMFFIGLVATTAGCSSDPARPEATPSPYHGFSEKGDVLFNLELAMNKMDAAHFAEVLDPDQFTFFFSPGDVGGSVPEAWSFIAERDAAASMLGGAGGRENNPILSIDLSLDDENAVWAEFDPTGHPGWYETTIKYSFHFTTANETHYITSGTELAQFRVRQDDGGKWRLAQWSDITGYRLNGQPASSGTEHSNWGKLKALYRPPLVVDVLQKLELAMNTMDPALYGQLLDPDEFTFFFTPGDVGGDIRESWGLGPEIVCATNMLGGASGSENNPILSIDLGLSPATANWREFDPLDFPNWYETTVGYAYTMRTQNDVTYITSGTEQASFRIRPDAAGEWHIVEWSDHAGLRAAPAGTEKTNWSKVKALYQ